MGLECELENNLINRIEEFEEKELIQMARKQFLRLLKISGFDSTEQSCVFGSHYLYMILKGFSKNIKNLQIYGGNSVETGAKNEDGSFANHMWVGGIYQGERWFFDITADQFGFPEILCIKACEAQDYLVADSQATTAELLDCLHKDDPVLAEMAGPRATVKLIHLS